MNARTIIAAVLIAATLAGCAKQLLINPNVTPEQAARDDFECYAIGVQMARQLYGPDGGILFGNEHKVDCLRSRGYH